MNSRHTKQFSMVRHFLASIMNLNSPYFIFSISTCNKMGFFSPLPLPRFIIWGLIIIKSTNKMKSCFYYCRFYTHLSNNHVWLLTNLFDSYVYLFGIYFSFQMKLAYWSHLRCFVYWASQTLLFTIWLINYSRLSDKL